MPAYNLVGFTIYLLSITSLFLSKQGYELLRFWRVERPGVSLLIPDDGADMPQSFT